MLDVNSGNFDAEVKKSSTPVVIDCWAAWCGPCRVFSPIFDEVEKSFKDKVKFAKLNVDENQDIAAEYNIMSIPTALLFDKGQVKAMSVGALPKEEFKHWLEKSL
jgi:thioredoxin 1